MPMSGSAPATIPFFRPAPAMSKVGDQPVRGNAGQRRQIEILDRGISSRQDVAGKVAQPDLAITSPRCARNAAGVAPRHLDDDAKALWSSRGIRSTTTCRPQAKGTL